MAARGRREGRAGATAKGRGVSFHGDENALDLVAIVAQPCDCTKTTELYASSG